MQDKILLGFLSLYGENTSYDIKKMMESSTNMFYNSSLGSINPAFKKLYKNKYVTVNEVVKNGRLKKIYKITKSGKAYFLEWMKTDIEMTRIKSGVLLRIFFFSLIEKDLRVDLIDKYLNEIKLMIVKLEATECIKAKNHETTCNFGEDTLRFGIDYYKFLYEWFKKYKEKQVSKEK